jgi:protein-disulfide isomerase
MPLGMHKYAFKAAQATHCSQEQGKFWEIHDSMMSDQKKLGELNSYAESINLDVAQFEGCLNTNKYAGEVQKDIAVARKLGVTGTPSFVLTRTDPKDPKKVKGISLLRGAQQFAAFKRLIDQALAEAQK